MDQDDESASTLLQTNASTADSKDSNNENPADTLKAQDENHDSVSQISNNKSEKNGELPKVVLERPWKTWGTFFQGQLVKSSFLHLIPLGVCCYLLFLDFKQQYWYDEDRPTVRNALQFPAKVLELLILASISSMVLHHAKRHLIGKHGIPFGLLSASYRVENVLLLRKKAFWWSAFRRNTWRLGIFVAFAALYSVLVGPSTAIAMIPSAGFYPFRRAFENSTGRLWFLWPGDDTILPYNMWPDVLNADTARCVTDNLTSNTLIGGDCPTRVFQDVLEWSWDHVDGDFTTIFDPLSRLTYQAVSSPVHMDNSNAVSLTVGSVPSEFVVSGMGSLWRNIKKNDGFHFGPIEKTKRIRLRAGSQLYQTVTQTRCEWIGDSTEALSKAPRLNLDGMINYDKIGGWKVERGTPWPIPKQSFDNLERIIKENIGLGLPWFDWIQARDVDAVGQFSIAALVSFPPLGLNDDESNQMTSDTPRMLTSCVFNAHWIPSDIVIDPTDESAQVQTQFTSTSRSLAKVMKHAQGEPSKRVQLPDPLSHIEIDPHWTDALNKAEVQDSELGQLMIKAVPQSNFFNTTIESNPEIVHSFINSTGSALNTIITTGLAHFGVRPISWFSGTRDTTSRAIIDGQYTTGDFFADSFYSTRNLVNNNLSDSIPLDDMYHLDIKVERYGYAFGARVPTIFFARAILLIYLGICVIYFIYALWDQFHSHPSTVKSWNNVDDLVALAWNSKLPEQMENCGAGIKRVWNWKQRIKIRANEEDKVEMLIDEGENHVPLRPGVSYR